MDQQTTKKTQEKSRPTGGERLVKQDTGGNAEAEVVLYQPDSSIHIEVLVEGETVWLTTQQMALLFSRDDSNIRRHIINIFSDGELQQENNVHFLHVNGVKKPVPYYNLDVIISLATVYILHKGWLLEFGLLALLSSICFMGLLYVNSLLIFNGKWIFD